MNKEHENKAQEIIEETAPEASEQKFETETDLQKALEEAEKLAEDYKDTAKRVQAEFENYRKRNNESARSAREDGVAEVILSVLPILDTVEIALNMVEDEKSKEGMRLIQKKAVAVLSKYGVDEIEAAGAEFDPAFHNAVMQIEDAEQGGKVVEVLQKGYLRNGKVLRYAMVKVAK